MKRRRRRPRFSDLGLDPIGLWEYLLRWKFKEAARGLLLDLLKETHEAVRAARLPQPDGGGADDGPTAAEVHAITRDWLMEVLADDDGVMTRQWLELYEAEADAVTAPHCKGALADLLIIHVMEAMDALHGAGDDDPPD
jgi:hypothetical protein